MSLLKLNINELFVGNKIFDVEITKEIIILFSFN